MPPILARERLNSQNHQKNPQNPPLQTFKALDLHKILQDLNAYNNMTIVKKSTIKLQHIKEGRAKMTTTLSRTPYPSDLRWMGGVRTTRVADERVLRLPSSFINLPDHRYTPNKEKKTQPHKPHGGAYKHAPPAEWCVSSVDGTIGIVTGRSKR